MPSISVFVYEVKCRKFEYTKSSIRYDIGVNGGDI